MANKKTKRELYYEEAQSLYIAGLELTEIEKAIPVSLKTLTSWKLMGFWDRKKGLVAEHPKLISDALKGLVKEKVKTLLSGREELNPGKIEELNKMIHLVERMEEKSWDERAAVVEVMSLFGNFIRREMAGKKELQLLAKLMERFFEEVEGS